MNRKQLTTLNEGLAYLLSTMYEAENRVREKLEGLADCATDPALEREANYYREIASSKIIKLERIFNYLMQDPYYRPNEVVEKLLEEAERVAKETRSTRLRNILLTGSLKALNNYKLSVYNTAKLMAVELEIETVTDLLAEILEWEKQTCTKLREIAFEEVTKQTPEISI